MVSNLSHIVANHVIELVLSECEKFGNTVGSKDRDIISNYSSLDDLQLTLASFINKNMRSFQEEKMDEDVDLDPTTEQPRNPIAEFMKAFEFDGDRGCVRFANNAFTWPVSYVQINDGFKQKTKQLCQAVISQIPHYFKQSKRDLMHNVSYLFDPKTYSAYPSLDTASTHGNNVIASVTEYFSVKKDKIGESFRTHKWRKFDVNAFRTEYVLLRQILWNNRLKHPNDKPQRFKYVLLQMEAKANIFVMTLLLFRKILCPFSGIIDVERQNGIKKWLVYSQRERLLIGKIDKILRIFCNSPGIDGHDKKTWLVQVAKKWWSGANRQIECAKLDKICNNDSEFN